MLKRSVFLKLLMTELCSNMNMHREIRQAIVCCILIFSTLFIYASKPSPYTMHVVKFGETLTKIAKKYDVSTTEVLQINPSLTANNIKPEQIIRIPNKNKSKISHSETSKNVVPVKVKEEEKPAVSSSSDKTHIVEQSQTLYAISKMYNVSIEDLQKWNGLSDYNIKIGSVLIVGKNASKPTPTISKVQKTDWKSIPTVDADSKVKPIVVNTKEPEIKTKPTESKRKEPEPIVKEPVATDETIDSGNSIEKPDIQASDNSTQKELLRIYKQQTASKKTNQIKGTGAPMTTTLGAMETAYFAMHKTLPIGTVLKIKNLVNSKVVYAKIIGKLPDTDENKHVIVRYSLGIKKDLQLQNGKCYVQIEYPE